MKNWKKRVALAMAFAIVAMSAAACGSKSGTDNTKGTNTSANGDAAATTTAPTKAEVQDVSLKVWAPEEEQDITAVLCNEFAKAHPEYNIKFEYAVMGNDAVCDELKKDLDVAADVFSYPSAAIPELTDAGILYPITLDVDTVKQINGDSAIAACTKDNNLYGVPETPNTWFMYYNKSLFNDTEVQNLDTMLAKDLGKDIKNFSCKISDSWYMSAFFYALGGTLYGADGLDPTSCSWNDANGMKVGKYLIDLSKNHNYVENLDGVGDSMFKEGKLGAICSGTWSATDYKAALGDNYAACKLPSITVEGKEYQLSNFADFKAFGVKSNTAYPKVAQQLAVFLGSEQSQLERYQSISMAPTATGLASNEQVGADLAVTALINQSSYSTPQPATPQLSEYWTPAIAFGTGIVNGDITEKNLQESLDSMVKSITTPAVK